MISGKSNRYCDGLKIANVVFDGITLHDGDLMNVYFHDLFWLYEACLPVFTKIDIDYLFQM